MRDTPGPRGLPLVGVAHHYLRDTLGYLGRLRADYGDVVRMRLGTYDTWLFCHPDHARHVLQTHHRRYHKGPEYDELKIVLGEGLLTSEDDLWRRQRKLAQPAFHRREVERLAEIIADDVAAMVGRWGGLEAVDAVAEMNRLTLDVVSHTLFTTELGLDAATISQAVTEIVGFLNRRISLPLKPPLWLPTPGHRRFRAARGQLDGQIRRFIQERRAAGEGAGDLLSLLLFSRDPDTGEAMSDEQLRDEVVTLFAAGHETTANGMVWTLRLLSEHPEVDARLAEEARAVLGDRPARPADLPELPYTRRVIQESLRLWPPAWGIGRQPIAPDVVGGYEVPAGALVFLCQYITHRHPDFWPDPERFDPDRFLPERAEGRHRFAWFPFGGGPRVCIGQSFAMMEMQLILASIAARWRLESAGPVAPDASITLRPKGPAPMRLVPRAGGSSG